MAITSQPQRADFPLSYELSEPLQTKKAWIKISQVRTLSVDRIGKRIGSITMEELDHLLEGLYEIIGK